MWIQELRNSQRAVQGSRRKSLGTAPFSWLGYERGDFASKNLLGYLGGGVQWSSQQGQELVLSLVMEQALQMLFIVS